MTKYRVDHRDTPDHPWKTIAWFVNRDLADNYVSMNARDAKNPSIDLRITDIGGHVIPDCRMDAKVGGQKEIFVPILDEDRWADWWCENGDQIEQDHDTARALAINQELMVGGGAYPLFRVGFVDPSPDDNATVKMLVEDVDMGLGLIPTHCRLGLRRYLVEGASVGGFLTAVVENDFMAAAVKADDENLGRLRQYADFLHNFAPAGAYGSKAQAKAWRDAGGIRGKYGDRDG